ncbi:MAG: hypothetical protein HYX53_00390 [Chloroflexi bacterium]|nr:hypothetical protein [Chloroflexota bacterium]
MGPRCERRASGEEAREGYLFVLKEALRFFPPAGEPFALLDDGQRHSATVESYPCTCRGPERPHEHWFIRRPGLRAGDRVAITAPGSSVEPYVLDIVSMR